MRQNSTRDEDCQSFRIIAPPLGTNIQPPLVVLECAKICTLENYSAIDNNGGFLLVYALSGKCKLVINKRRQQISESEAVILSRNSSCEYINDATDETPELITVRFDGCGSDFYAGVLNIEKFVKIHVRNKTNLQGLFNELISAMEKFDNYHLCVQTDILCRILTLLATEQKSTGQTEKINSAQKETINTVSKYIDENHWQSLTLEALAIIAGMSKYHFLRIFKAVTGVAPHKYVLLKRIEAAKKILRTSDASMYEVCIMVGFKDEGHFNRTFKNITQTTPFQYKTQTKQQ